MSVLFERMELDIGPDGTGKITEEQREKFKVAEDEFIKLIGSGFAGTRLVQRIYDVMDELETEVRQKYDIVCEAGCSFCCHQLVACTTLEMRLITSYIQRLSKLGRRAIKKRVKKAALNFHRFFQSHKYEFGIPNPSRWEDIVPELRAMHLGKPCLYLDKQRCSVYPVRPLDCRSARATKKCGFQGERKKFTIDFGIKLYFDQIVANLVFEEEKRVNKQLFLVPLIGWPISEQFVDYFI